MSRWPLHVLGVRNIFFSGKNNNFNDHVAHGNAEVERDQQISKSNWPKNGGHVEPALE